MTGPAGRHRHLPADPGLQAERTSLSWRRTAMSVAVGSLVGLKVLPPHLGVLGYVFCVLGLMWSADLARAARHRYWQGDALLRAAAPRDAGPTVARTAAMTLAASVAALTTVVATALTT
ncbi:MULTISPECIES: DUF202 domain-containing protein [unclassified Streptomyces]|nr:DUF202 domain-containing protein [Streptomyces sp. SM1]